MNEKQKLVERQPYARSSANGIKTAVVIVFGEAQKLFHSQGWWKGDVYVRLFPSILKASQFLKLVHIDMDRDDGNILETIFIPSNEKRTMPFNEYVEHVVIQTLGGGQRRENGFS